jgi:hypothetical protein
VLNTESLLAFRTAVIMASITTNDSTYFFNTVASLAGVEGTLTWGRALTIWPIQARPRTCASDLGSIFNKYDTMDSVVIRLLVSERRVDIALILSSNTIEAIREGKSSIAAFLRSSSGGFASPYTLCDHDDSSLTLSRGSGSGIEVAHCGPGIRRRRIDARLHVADLFAGATT